MRLLLLLSAILAALSGSGGARAAELRQVEASATLASRATVTQVSRHSPAPPRYTSDPWTLPVVVAEPQPVRLTAISPLFRLRPRE